MIKVATRFQVTKFKFLMSFVTTQTGDKNKPKEIKEGFEDGLDPITRIFCQKKKIGAIFLKNKSDPR